MSFDVNTLSEIEKTALFALYRSCDSSYTAHWAEGAILRGLPSHIQGHAGKALKKLVKKQLCWVHPTGRNTTYGITVLGRIVALMLLGN